MSMPQQSRLLSLPAELRLLIYETTFEGHILDFRCDVNKIGSYNKLPPPGLLVTCKQLYAEAIDIFYTSATLGLSRYPPLYRILAQIPQSRWHAIKGVELDVTQSCAAGELEGSSVEGSRFHEDVRERLAFWLKHDAGSLGEKVWIKCLNCGRLGEQG